MMTSRGNHAPGWQRKRPDRRCGGQAVVEFIIALISILALAAGLLQLTSLMLAHTRTMVAARQEAGEASVQPIAPLSDAEFIRDWEEGSDTVPYTSDDDVVLSSAAAQFANLFAERASTDAGWAYVEMSPSDQISPMRSLLAPSTLFGLVEGHDTETVPLLPAVRTLLYDAESVRVESKVWMTFCGGLY